MSALNQERVMDAVALIERVFPREDRIGFVLLLAETGKPDAEVVYVGNVTNGGGARMCLEAAAEYANGDRIDVEKVRDQ